VIENALSEATGNSYVHDPLEKEYITAKPNGILLKLRDSLDQSG
jgi:hypothetical protein